MAERHVWPGDGARWFRVVPADDLDGDGQLRRLEIADEPGEPPYLSRVAWPARFALDAAWDEGGRVWVRSADTGLSVFERRNGEWTRLAWASDRGPGDPPLYDVSTGEDLRWSDATPPTEFTRAPHAR